MYIYNAIHIYVAYVSESVYNPKIFVDALGDRDGGAHMIQPHK